MGHTAAALAATSLAFARVSTPDARAFSAQALTAAVELYVLAAANEGIYSENFIPNQKVGHIFTAHEQIMPYQVEVMSLVCQLIFLCSPGLAELCLWGLLSCSTLPAIWMT